MSITPPDTRPRLLLVDDMPANLQILSYILQQDYRLLFARDGDKALQLARQELPDLILLDVMMPGLTGYDVCRRLKAEAATMHIPVIFVTALTDTEDEAQGFALGGVDYITKPVRPPIVLARVRNQLSLVQAEELRQTRLQIIQRLGLAAEYKDNETGLHVIRMSHYTRILARAAGLPEALAEEMFHAAPMHDIGKIGIPDAILQKPTALDATERAIMDQHTRIGARILANDRSPLLQMATRIALSHHERWDGDGYPQRLAGEAIPLEARIVAVADVFDALTSVRPYKPAWPVDDALAYLRAQRGGHFDPALVNCFIDSMALVMEVQERWAEV